MIHRSKKAIETHQSVQSVQLRQGCPDFPDLCQCAFTAREKGSELVLRSDVRERVSRVIAVSTMTMTYQRVPETVLESLEGTGTRRNIPLRLDFLKHPDILSATLEKTWKGEKFYLRPSRA